MKSPADACALFLLLLGTPIFARFFSAGATMTIDELIENFELFNEWEDRYRYVIDLGRALPPLEPQYHTDAFKVEGCMI